MSHRTVEGLLRGLRLASRSSKDCQHSGSQGFISLLEVGSTQVMTPGFYEDEATPTVRGTEFLGKCFVVTIINFKFLISLSQ